MLYFTTALVLILKEIGFFWRIKKLIEKENYYLYKKPYDCFFCLSFWANTIVFSILAIININENLICNYGVAIILSKIIDLLWNKN